MDKIEPPIASNVFLLLVFATCSLLPSSSPTGPVSTAVAESRMTTPVTIAAAPKLAILFSVKRLSIVRVVTCSDTKKNR